jgi:hypothetical protein
VDGKAALGGEPAPLGVQIQESLLAGTEIVRANVNSAAKGVFRACGLTPGKYRATATDSHKLTGSVEFIIEHSDIHDIQVNIDPVRLRLSAAWDGDPPPEVPPRPYSWIKIKDSWVAFDIKEKKMVPGAPPDDLLKALQASEVGEGGSGMRMTDAVQRFLLAERPRELRLRIIGADNQDAAAIVVTVPYEGALEHELSGGDYVVDARVSGSYIKQITFNGVTYPDRLLHLVPGSGGVLSFLVAHDGGAIAFSVRDADGNPVPEATILLVPETATDVATIAGSMQSGQTDRDGSFVSETLAPGKYRAVALTKYAESMEKLSQAFAASDPIEVSLKATVKATLHPVALR